MATAALFAGSFDPITLGHQDIMRRGMGLVGRFVVAVAESAGKAPMFTLDERRAMVEEELAAIAKETGGTGEVIAFRGLLVDVARKVGARTIVRSLRDAGDYGWESQLANMNRVLAPTIDTVLLVATPATSMVSSTLVREISRMGGDIKPFVSASVAVRLRARVAEEQARAAK